MSSIGCSTPVDVSLAWTRIALIDLFSLRASSITLGLTAFPHSTFISIVLTPYALQIFSHRSPNLPPLTTKAVSPLLKVLQIAASIAPVPEEAKIKTSSSVIKTFLRPWVAL